MFSHRKKNNFDEVKNYTQNISSVESKDESKIEIKEPSDNFIKI